MVKLFLLLRKKTCVYDGYSLDFVKNEFYKKKDFVILWPRATRHSHLPQASE